MPEKCYDLIIVGAGPAGITAAVYAARKKLDVIVISRDIGGQASWSGDIENYTGWQFVTGPELTLKFEEHMKAFGITARIPESIQSLELVGGKAQVTTDRASYLARAVIIATGKRPRELQVPGEQEYKNRGVTYCATCDGPLFRDKPVAVVGGGNSALDAALQLLKICPRVYLIVQGGELIGEPVMREAVHQAANVEILHETEVRRIAGEQFVSRVDVAVRGVPRTLAVQGVFVEIGLYPNADFRHALQLNQQREIIVDAFNKTSLPGVFAAGDVTNVPEKQIIIACGEGAKACLTAFRYIVTNTFAEEAH
jgi:alkyl hydroperoxide reductase subunit F